MINPSSSDFSCGVKDSHSTVAPGAAKRNAGRAARGPAPALPTGERDASYRRNEAASLRAIYAHLGLDGVSEGIAVGVLAHEA
jgi:hypothetical protein